jgi:hypothetical protein
VSEEADEIAASLAKPKRVRTEAGEVEQHPLREQVEAAKFVAAQRAVANPWLCLRFAQITPPGATD